MDKNLKAQLEIFKIMDIKPNFSELARTYNKHRQTIKKYYEGYEGKPKTRNKSSKLDKYYDQIKEKLSINGCTMQAIYKFLDNKYKNIGTYSNFKKYVAKHKLKQQKRGDISVRYETEFGKQLQFDFKENLTLYNKFGQRFDFNIFSATLGASRMHSYIYCKNKTRQDVQRGLIETFKYFNGVPEELLTDNMKCIVDIPRNVREKARVNVEFKQFCKDIGCNIRLCKVRRPKTKGKVESSNRFMDWLIPYNGEFETEEDLINIIKNVTKQVNSTINQTIGVTPVLLFQTEKEYLKPLPNQNILNSYQLDTKRVKVDNSLLIYYKGNRYSVPPSLANKSVSIKETDNQLYVYYNKNLITIHHISNKKINYHKEHYKDGISSRLKYKTGDEINNIVEQNLNILDKLMEVTNE